MGINKYRAVHKVKGGKLLRCAIELDNNIIVHARITGDFFMHPEESISELENILKGTELDKEILKEKITRFYNSDVRIIGAGIDDFVALLIKCGGKQ